MKRSEFIQQTIIALAPYYSKNEDDNLGLMDRAEAIANKYDSLYTDFEPEDEDNWADGEVGDVKTVELPVDFKSGVWDTSWAEGRRWAQNRSLDTPDDFDKAFDDITNPEVVQMVASSRAGAYAYLASRAVELLRQQIISTAVRSDLRGAYNIILKKI